MDKHFVSIIYKLANGKQIRIDVPIEVKELLEQTDRQICSQRRQDKRHLNFVENMDDLDTGLISPQEGIADLVCRISDYNQLYAAIGKLPELQRRRLCLYFFGGLTYSLIAEIEGVGLGRIASSVERAKNNLKKSLNE